MSMFEETNMDEHELVNAFSRQTISFNGISDFASHEVHGREVSVEVGEGTHGGGSSKLFTKVVVNFSWDNKYYIGSQVAVDYTGTFMAYALVLDGDCPGAVRVVSLKDEKRGLVRAMRGPVKDLDFSYHTSCLLLAAVDAYGHLYVYNVGRSQDRLDLTPLLTVTRDHVFEASEYHRVVWCTYLTEASQPRVGPDRERILSSEPVLEADPSTFLILTDEADVEVWDTRAVATKFGAGPFNYLDLMKQMTSARKNASAVDRYVGYSYLTGHEKPVVQAVFSPDGGAVATASQDGQVRFFQVDLDSDPMMLHSFLAHEGRPLSCLYFLDNMRVVSDDKKLWKYAITGADYNREIKLWCCGTFSCLQTITFRPPPSLDSWFKVEVDATGSYILMSDIHRRMLYVLLFHEAEEESSSSSHIASISEFPLALPFLSLKIRDAGRRKVKRGASDEDVFLNGECGDENGEHKKKVFVKMFAVQPKGIQECTVLFDPHSSVPDGASTASFPTFSLDESVVQDNLAELSAACLGGILDYEDDSSQVMQNGTSVEESVPVKTELVEIKQEREEELGAVGGASSSAEVSPTLINFDAGAQSQGLNNESFITPPQPKEINKIKNLVELPDQRQQLPSSSSSSNSSQIEEERPGSENWARPGAQGLDETLKSLKDVLKELKDEKKAERNRKEALRQEVSGLRAEMVNLRTIVNSRAAATTDVRVTDALASLDSASRTTAKKVDEIQKSLAKGLNKKDVDSITVSVAKSIDANQIRNTITQTGNELRQNVRNDVKKELQGVHNQLKKVADVAGQPGQISEAQARAIGSALTSPVAKYLEQAVAGIFAPVLDRMAQAVDKSFRDLGTAVGNEVVGQVRNVTTTVQSESENLVRQLKTNQPTLDTEKLIAAIVQANNQAILRANADLKAELLQTVKKEIAQAVRDQSATMTAAVLRSAASTPAPTAQARLTQETLMDLVQSGNPNEAFKRAIGAVDPHLLEFLLKKINVPALIGKKGLESGTLLALMQQLSVSIGTKTDVKVDILQAGVSIIDPRDTVVKEHLPPVGATLKSHLVAFVQAHPESRHCGTIRLIVLAVDALMMQIG